MKREEEGALTGSRPRAPEAAGGPPRDRNLAELAATESRLRTILREEIGRALDLPGPAPADAGFFALGGDSVQAEELRTCLNDRLGRTIVLSPTALFDYPSASSLARRLARGAAGDRPPVGDPGRPDGVAVVGMACRFPGGEDLDGFRKLVESGGDAVVEGDPGSGAGRVGRLFPDRRPPPDPRRFGAFVPRMDHFDAAFFGIPDAEAHLMDPQHRLLLEVSWHALENAGIAPESLAGTRTGVFAGVGASGYLDLVPPERAASVYAVTGSSASCAVGRVAFALGLEGPAIAVDTASSSSLVAVHQAASAILGGDAELVLAGGVNVIASGARTETFAAGGMLSPEGRCRSWDAGARGYVRGEGCGIVVLKRLSAARAAGDRILGVIRGTAVNQDGASSGLTAPRGPAQERLIEEALARAGWAPADVQYLEGHGSGTPLGDPIEVAAALAVYGRERKPARPLLLSSVKGNVGHLEAAAGIAGLINVLLAIGSGRLPAQVHFEQPNPRIAWADLPVRVVTESMDWPSGALRRRAGVSSFGLSGTNAHVLVEEAAPEAAPVREEAAPEEQALVLALSAKTPGALSRLAGRYRSWIGERPGVRLADLAWTAAVGRSALSCRAGVVFRNEPELVERLAAVEAGDRGVPAETAPTFAFVFPGQGGQWPGMGRTLYGAEPAVRDVLDRCDAVFREEEGDALLPVIFGAPDAAGDLDATAWTQPALYALGCGLAALWKSYSLAPAAVLGHSAGEVAAAHAAGMVSLEEGMRFAIRRGRLMGSVRSGGAMGAVFLRAPEAEQRVPELRGDGGAGRLEVASDNGGHQVLSGPRPLLEAVLERLAAEGVRTAMLSISEASHSALMDPILDRIEAAGAALPVGAGTVPFVSSMTGEVIRDAREMGGAYWRRQIRNPVRFAAAVGTLADLGVRVLVDLGPRGRTSLTASGAWPRGTPSPLLVPTLTGPRDSAAGAAEALARAWESGMRAPLEALFGERRGRRSAAPMYPFERRRYWVDEPDEEPARGRVGVGLAACPEPVAARTRRIEAFLRREMRGFLRLETAPPADVGFLAAGLESLQVVELRHRLNRALGGAAQVSEADFFSYPTPSRLAAHVATRTAVPTGAPREARVGVAVAPRVRVADRIAVVGMGCRFPGGGGLDDFWRRLLRGDDLVTEGRPGGELAEVGSPGGRGAYVSGLDRFDAEFFRIAPVEAELLDPQQRLLLEVTWEALEEAGIAPGSLAGSRTGVFAGMFASDFGGLVAHTAPGLYRSTGWSFSAAIGRVAYTLGLEGPAVAVETACSASLVAVHQAVAALERREVDLALAGGVNAVLGAGLTEAFAAAGMLAEDGRCKTFDARADGYVRGEGCGMVVLKRLSDAERDGDRILGVLLGSAVNQDGASAGLTVPNGLAQERLIREALGRAGVRPSDVDYLEAHGTGTELGDPVEVRAAASVYGEGRDAEHPLLMGSVKTNVGHLEAAAGVAGLIKVLLAMRDGVIPEHLHFETPNPRIEWEKLPVRVTASATRWPERGRPRRAGVSSFGYSGTNAHVVVEGYSSNEAAEAAVRERRVLPLSGRSGAALSELAERYLGWLGEDGASREASELLDMAWTAGVGRSHFGVRAGVVFGSEEELRSGLRDVSSGVMREAVSGEPPKVAFLYTGQGSQRGGMGRDLYETEPVFREVLGRCEAVFREERGGSLLPVMFGEEEGVDRTEWTQPALFALSAGLTELWRSVGVVPSAVLGHSVGEIGAAWASGALGLEEGMRFAARRGALMGSLPAGGGMAAVFAPVVEVEVEVGKTNARAKGVGLSVAAENGTHVVVSGPRRLLRGLCERLARRGIRTEGLRTSHAFHSGLLDPVLAALEEAGSELSWSTPEIVLVSNVTGRPVGPGEEWDGGYWRRQARERVRFASGVDALAELGVGVLVEVGPGAVLGPLAALGWRSEGGEAPAVVTSVGRETGFVDAVGGAYEAGLAVSFEGLFAGERRRRVSLPTYPFQRERYWVRRPRRRAAGVPLLGVRRDGPGGETSFETEFYGDDPGWVSGHRVFGEVVAPGALYAAQALGALRETGQQSGGALVEAMIHRPLVFSGEEGRTVQVVMGPADAWRVVSRAGEDSDWELHAEGRVAVPSPSGEALDVDRLREGEAGEAPEAVYRRLAARGIEHEGVFRVLTGLWSGREEALGEVALPADAEREELWIHPALLDGCFQVLAGVLATAEESGTWLPLGWERLWVDGRLPPRLWCRARMRDGEGDLRRADLELYGQGGEPLGGVVGFTLRRASRSALLGLRVDELLHEVRWREGPPVGAGSADCLRGPEEVAAGLGPVEAYLEREGLDRAGLEASGGELEREARSYALRAFEELGWERRPGSRFTSEELRHRLRVTGDYRRLFGRLLELLAEDGEVSRESADGWVDLGRSDGLVAGSDASSVELALLRRCGGSLAEVLRGRRDPLDLLFGEAPGAAEVYRESAVGRVMHRMVADAVAAVVGDLPKGRRLRVLEVGAGTGATTAAVLGALPEGTDYEFTDISAGFFGAASSRFRDTGRAVRYRTLDIEGDPAAQGFGRHGYDLVIAANVLHATRDLGESLGHCRELLAPWGMLVAVEATRALGWLDLTFGLLPGWWRFEDAVRREHALLGPEVWSRVLSEGGYGESALLGTETGQAVILARGPAEVAAERGLFVLSGGVGFTVAVREELTRRGQEVVVGPVAGDRAAWRSLFAGLPEDVPLRGVAHLAAVRGDSSGLTTDQLEREVEEVGSSALSLVQGMTDAGVRPFWGTWFVTRGGQVVERERSGTLSGSLLWGFGSVVDLEYGDLNARVLDLDPGSEPSAEELADELLFPDRETRVARRGGGRLVARLTRLAPRAELPVADGYRLAANPTGALDPLRAEEAPPAPLAAGEIRVAVEAAGLNFHDVLVALRVVDADQPLGTDVCGRVVEVGAEVAEFAVGDRIVGFASGAVGRRAVTRAALVAKAPPRRSPPEWAGIPSAYVTAALAYEFAELARGARVLIHAGTGGVGHAAIELARAAELRVYATASAAKQPYLRSLGVAGVFDSRDPAFGQAVLAATGGSGVDLVLNSLTGEGFIEANLSCLAPGGCFVELGKRGIWSEERIAAVRADARYRIVALDELARREPERVGAVLRKIVEEVASGALAPLPFTRWPLAEAGTALTRMREARHVGKLVLVPSAVSAGRLRGDRSYLVTGGFGGIGLEVAGWLAASGAGAIVLNGRRAPDADAAARIERLRARGAEVRVEIADVTDGAAVEGMLRRLDAELPPLAGVIHGVGTLADGVLANQDWGRFETVLGPKVAGAWRLHRATLHRELDLFVLFSSVTGVLGNAGQANHAAANAFLDQLARHRRSLGLPGQAIAWGAWSEVGEAEARRERMAGRAQTTGRGWMAPERGIEAFARLLRLDVGTSVVAALDMAALTSPPPLLEELAGTDVEEGDASPARLGELPPTEREPALVAFVQEQLIAILRLRSAPSPTTGFFELGMDSLMAVELRNRLQRAFGEVLTVSNTVVFDHPDALRLGRYLAQELGDATPEPSEAPAGAQAAALTAAEERVAIVGMACRFPGGADAGSFWDSLLSGSDAVTRGRPDGLYVDEETEAARFPGAYVEGMDGFDAGFFRIAPVEAELMDPQQRLLLEVSWAALEDAGMAPAGLRGSRTGVYGGMCGHDYEMLVGDTWGEPASNLYRSTGITPSAAMGRVAFALGLEGPALTVDTACSSSLVAIHQAAGALRQGEANLALAGGVNAILTGRASRIWTDAGMLAADGLCKTFDARADGFVRGEGCGMVVLKRLSDAERDGDRVLGVLLGSAVNQDGASAGLTVPNGPSQERVIREALGRAGVRPSDVDYLEAHGTGTELGDPVEVRAAASVYGEGRDAEHPLLMGSVKTNVGHLEAAAGVAGLIKVLLAMRDGVIPEHLHFETPNPRIEWEKLPVRVTASATRWPERGRPRRAGVSSFGFSGTNAHVVVEGYSSNEAAEAAVRERRVLPLSGRSGAALSELAERYLGWLGEDGASREASELLDMAWTAGVGRSHFGVRAGVVFGSEEELRSGLRDVSSGVMREAVSGEPPKVAFLYTGQGSQRGGMGRDLYETEPVFREVLGRCEAVFREERGGSLLPVMFGEEEGVDRTEWTQPALFALSAGLTELWRSVGVVPSAVLGHSVGEIGAAWASGALGLEEGMRFAARRGALMGSLPAGGGMAAVFAPVVEVEVEVGKTNARAKGVGLSVAAENGTHVVVSGPRRLLRGLCERLARRGIRTEGLRTSHAFHSGLLDPVLAALEEAGSELSWSTPEIVLVSNVTGRPVGPGEEWDGGYWRRQARERVRFASGVDALAELGVGVLVEVGPGAVLGPLAALGWRSEGGEAPAVVTSVGRETGFVDAVGGAYEAGLAVSFEGLFAGERRRRVSLPTYPFQRERYWVRRPRRRAAGVPLLGVRRDGPGGETSFETEFYGDDPGWVSGHRVFGEVVAPGALYAAQALGALRETGQQSGGALVEAMIHRPLVFSGEEGRTVQVVMGPADAWRVVSRAGEDSDWELHAEGRVAVPSPSGEALDVDRLREGEAGEAPEAVYRRLAARGIEHEGVFRVLTGLWSGREEALGEVALPADAEREELWIHPALLDGCFQVLAGVLATAEESGTWLPLGWERLWVGGRLPPRLWCRARMRSGEGDLRRADLELYGSQGEPLGAVVGCTLRRANPSALFGVRVDELLHEVQWREGPPVEEVPAERGLFVLSGGGAFAGAMREELTRRGQEVVVGPVAGDRAAWGSLFAGLPEGVPLRGVAHLAAVRGDGSGLTTQELEREVEEVGSSALSLVQGMTDAGVRPSGGTWFVTRGGQVVEREPSGTLSGSLLWGFGSVVDLEYGDLNARVLDLDPGSAPSAGELADELLFPDWEMRVARRGGGRLVARLTRLEAERAAPSAASGGRLRGDRSYLVTGGFGGIGLEVAGWLAASGAGAIVLNGRRAPDADAAARIERLRARGAEVRVEIADVTDGAAVEGMLRRLDAELPPLAGVIHGVGTLADGVLANQDWGRFETVLGPKVAGAWRLHRATLHRELDLFVLFSSVTGVLGNAGQANYAAANAFLDQLARHRRSLGLPGQAIAWGAWSDVGQAAARRERMAGRLLASGQGWMAPERGIQAFARLLRLDVGASVVAPLDVSVLTSPPPLLEELAGAGTGEAEATPEAPPARLLELPPGDREPALVALVQEHLMAILRLRSVPSPTTGFFELGMDSLMAVELRNRLQRAFGGVLTVSNTVAFDYPDVSRLARHLAEELGDAPVEPPVASAGAWAAALSATAERVAIVGMACRFPGGPDAGPFWESLLAGADAVTRGRPDGLYVDEKTEAARSFGAYVADLDRFDAEFFRIAPLEANLLDPQQRLLLEVSWAALEDAGMDPAGLRGSRTGVYGGIMRSDYRDLVEGLGGGAAESLYRSSGVTPSTAVGRISFALGLTGPAVAVDTACSSSLVAIHQAAGALRQGEADLALAGGVNAILISMFTNLLADAGALAEDGRCKTFDARADGYVRGEGCGMVVLKRLSDAERDGDRILGVLLGSAVNQDGASAGLTVPNGLAQERLIREALGRAGVRPSDVDYLEAHGTGTELGDPVEVRAAASVYGEGRDAEHPLLMGSVKTNVGHLEAAAGVAGLIKVLLAMRDGVIPEHLHFETPNPRIEWEKLPVRVTASATRWPERGRPRRAGVSSFGYSGTNAHVVVEGYSSNEAAEAAVRERRVLPLSGRSGAALSELAERYLGWLGEDGASREASELLDMAWTAGVGRSHFGVRAGVVFGSEEELRSGLRDVSSGVMREAVSGEPPKVAFLYTGQGSQRGGMGRDLYETEPVFREVLGRCEAVFREERGGSLLPVMFGEEEGVDRTEWTQPALFALSAGLTELWRSVGVVPSAVLGHSVGEIGAAWASGALGLEEGMRFAARRGALMGSLPAGGGMAAVFAPVVEVEVEVGKTNARAKGVGLSVAAENGTHVVVSGPRRLLRGLCERLARRGIRTEGLRTSHAFHSGLLDPVLAALEEAGSELSWSTPEIVLVSNVTGRPVGPGEEWDGGYWRRQARERVRFASGVDALAELGVGVLVEVGPGAVLGPLAALGWRSEGGEAPAVVTSVGRETGFVDAVGGAYEAGLAVSFEGLFAGERRRRVSLPTYPFQRERYWVRRPRRRAAGVPLLGVRRDGPGGETSFETEFYGDDPGWVSGHRVFGEVVAPGALYAAQALGALRETGQQSGGALVEAMIHRPLVFSGEEGRTVQVVMGPADAWRVVSRAGEDSDWELHAEGRVAVPSPSGEALDVDRLREGEAGEAPEAVYRRLAARGIEHEGVFRVLTGLWSGREEALGEVALPADAEREELWIHPALLDGCFQVLAGVLATAEESGTWLPLGWERLWVDGRLPPRLWCRARMRDGEGDLRRADLELYGQGGEPLGGVVGFTLRRASRSALLGLRVDELLHEVRWREGPPVGAGSADCLRGPEEVAAGLGPVEAYLEREGLDRAGLEASGGELEREARSYALRAFEELGWERRPGSRFTSEELRHRLRVTGDYRRLFGRLLELLAEDGEVSRESADGWVDLGRSDGLVAGSDASSVELALLRRCGGSLAEVLRGRRDPLDLLFGEAPGAAEVYRESAVGRVMHRMVADAVAAVVGDLPKGRRLRVLEVGAGTGATTAAVLGALPEGTDYEFTDISAGFFGAASSRFRDTGRAVRYRTLDIEGDPAAQGFGRHGYDLVIAANVLHATRDLGESLGHCRELLAPWGMLVAVEATRALGWLDLTFGLLPGWWRFEDAVRREHALLGPEVWSRVLSEGGYGESALLGTETGQAVILARGPAEVAAERGLFVLSGGVGFTVAVREELTRRGQEVVVGPVAGDRAAWRSLFAGLPEDVPLRGVAHLAAVRGDSSGLTTDQLEREVEEVGSSALSLVQGMTDAGVRPFWGTWFVTRGGQVVERERSGTLSGSLLWGFGSVVDLEYGDLNARVLDLDPGSEPSAEELADELLFPDRETRVARRGGKRRVARLVRSAARVPAAGDALSRVRADRSYLVTGGLGGIGLRLAGWLAEAGAGAVVLNGRRAPDPDAATAIGELCERGVDVRVEIADVTDGQAVTAMLARMDAAGLPLGGLFHSVGVLADAAITNQDWGRFETVLAPKVVGAWRLHRAMLDRELDLFVLFSSVSGVLGNAGQANHAAANAFLDQLARHRRSLGLPGQAIAWGPWSGLGEAEEQRDRIARRLASRGVAWVTPAEGFRALERLLRENVGTAAVASVDWPAFEAAAAAHPFFAEVTGKGVAGGAPVETDGFAARVRAAPAASRERLVLDVVREELRLALGRPSAPPPDVPFFDLGMDSLMAVELRTRLNRRLAGEFVVPNTIAFNYPSAQKLARHLVERLASGEKPAPDAPASPPRRDPASALSVEEFAEQLALGEDDDV